MIKIKYAPAGWIAQFFSDTTNPKFGPDHRTFLGVTGDWCPTRDEAIASVKRERAKTVAKLTKKRDAYLTKISEEIDAIADTRDDVFLDK